MQRGRVAFWMSIIVSPLIGCGVIFLGKPLGLEFYQATLCGIIAYLGALFLIISILTKLDF